MAETVESQFTVQDIVNDDIWLKDLNRGLTVAVEASSPYYNQDIKRKINRLSVGDVISAELQSQNQLHTIWTFDNVEFDSRTDRSQAVV